MNSNNAPLISIVIPVYNEERILYSSIEQLVAQLCSFNCDFEIVIAENGSNDRTVEIAEELAEKYKFVHLMRSPVPDYGYALKAGIQMATGKYVFCDEIDLCILDFYKNALSVLQSNEADMVVGSKVLAESNDERPFTRRFATRVINGMLRVGVGFKGTDTHGLKSFNRERILPVVERCELGKDLFASELVVRTERGGFRVREIPLNLREIRPPSINLSKRVPRVLRDMAHLIYLIRIKG